MRRRGCLIAVATFAGLVLLCCVLGVFVLVPRLRDTLTDEFSDALGTEVANQISTGSGDLAPGTYTLSIAQLRTQIAQDFDDSGAEDFDMSVDESGMSLSFTYGSQEFGYTGTPVARDGRLVMEDMQVNDDALGWFMPADRLGDTVENGINRYFDAQGLDIESVELGDDEMIFSVVDAGL